MKEAGCTLLLVVLCGCLVGCYRSVPAGAADEDGDGVSVVEEAVIVDEGMGRAGADTLPDDRNRYPAARPEPKLSPPVYNAEISPIQSRQPLRIRSGVPTSLRFFIGKSSPANVLGSNISADLVVNSGTDEDLLVVLDCPFCLEDTNQVEAISYSAGSASSTIAHFRFTPERSRVEPSGGLGRLLLSVLTDEGLEIEFIEIPVLVGSPDSLALAAYHEPRSYEAGGLPASLGQAPDLVLFVGGELRSGMLPVRLYPMNDSLRARTARAVGDPAGVSWNLRSGMGEASLRSLGVDIYQRLTQLARASDPVLAGIYDAEAGGASHEPVTTAARLLPSDSTQVVNVLHSLGRELYLRFFMHGERKLQLAMLAVEAFADESQRPLRVRIHNTGPYVAWQLLYPFLGESGDTVDASRFWGIRYELGVRQRVHGQVGRISSRVPWPDSATAILGTHRSDSVIVNDARAIHGHLAAQIPNGMQYLDRRGDFFRKLNDDGPSVTLLLLFMHGSAARSIRDNTGQPVRIPPKLLFNTSEAFRPVDLDSLYFLRLKRERQDVTGIPYLFDAQPIVILGACESGTGGLEPATDNEFVGSFLRSGASAVVATEAAVWVSFTADFMRGLATRLLAGQSVAAAMRDERADELKKRRNALGLVFALYGNPAARFSKGGS